MHTFTQTQLVPPTFACSFPSLVFFHIPWHLNIPWGSSWLSSTTTYSTFPLFREHMGNCFFFSQNTWHRNHTCSMYNIWRAANFNASVHNVCINVLCVNALLQTLVSCEHMQLAMRVRSVCLTLDLYFVSWKVCALSACYIFQALSQDKYAGMIFKYTIN